MEEQKPDVLFKIVLMGDAGVGKSSLINRAVRNIFSEFYKLTMGVDFALKVHSWVERGVRFQWWDIAGAERFGNMMPTYLRETDAVILMWDATRPATFDALPQYLQFIKKDLPIIFVRSKADQDNKDVQDDLEARKKIIAEWTASRGTVPEDVAIMDTSSKDSLGIDELENAMLTLMPRLIQKQEERKNSPVVSRPVSREVLRAPPPRVAAPVAPQTPSIFSERLAKIQHTRKPRRAELEQCFAVLPDYSADEAKAEKTLDFPWVLLHLDSIEPNCETARFIRQKISDDYLEFNQSFEDFEKTIVRPKEGPVVELLKLLDEEERSFAPKIITLLFFASYSDRKVAERDIERKFILDVAKNLYLKQEPFQDLDHTKAPKAVLAIVAKHSPGLMN